MTRRRVRFRGHSYILGPLSVDEATRAMEDTRETPGARARLDAALAQLRAVTDEFRPAR